MKTIKHILFATMFCYGALSLQSCKTSPIGEVHTYYYIDAKLDTVRFSDNQLIYYAGSGLNEKVKKVKKKQTDRVNEHLPRFRTETYNKKTSEHIRSINNPY